MYKCKNCGYDGCNDTYTEKDVTDVIERLGNYIRNCEPLEDRKFEYTRYDEAETKLAYNEDLQAEVKRRLDARGLDIEYERFRKGEFFGGNLIKRQAIMVHIRIARKTHDRYTTEALYGNKNRNDWNRIKNYATDDLEKIQMFERIHKDIFDLWYTTDVQKLYNNKYPQNGLHDTTRMARLDAIQFFMKKYGYW